MRKTKRPPSMTEMMHKSRNSLWQKIAESSTVGAAIGRQEKKHEREQQREKKRDK